MSSDTGFELGKELAFDYALVPHDGDWRAAGIYRDGWEFNNPLIICKAVPRSGPNGLRSGPNELHSGPLPKRWGWLEVSEPNVLLSALKPGPDETLIVRVYEAAGKFTPGVQIKVGTAVRSVEETNLMEDSGPELVVSGDIWQFDLRPFEIQSFRLRI
jgi:alpha-mannosidase